MSETTFEAITTKSELLAAARGHGLELRAEQEGLDEMGLDFRVLHARDADGAQWIVRTPRRPDVVAAARREAAVLRLVAPRLPVAVPEWTVAAADVIAHRRIAGTPAITIEGGAVTWNGIRPDRPLPGAFLDSLAEALGALLAIPQEEARDAGVRVRDIWATRAEIARAIDLAQSVLPLPDPLRARWQRWLDGDGWPPELALTHGDLHAGHMLLDGDARLVGVLDWTEARVTDPSIDLAFVVGTFGRPVLDELMARIARHGVVLPPSLADHTEARWSVTPAMIAAWAIEHDHEAALEHARAMLYDHASTM